MNITKSSGLVYKIRDTDGCLGWADITINESFFDHPESPQNPFRIHIASDWGNWTFFWSHPGKCWRSFLINISIDYAADKFGADSVYDHESTRKIHLNKLIEDRREYYADKIQVREAYDAVNTIFNDCDNESVVLERLLNSEWHTLYGECWHDVHETIKDLDPRFISFWNGCWHYFIDNLKKEIDIKSEA